MREQIEDGLGAPLNCQVGVIIRVQAVAFVVEDVTLVQRRSPIYDPALLGTETVVNHLIEFANVDAVYKPRHSDEAGADVVVNAFVGEVQSIAFQVKLVRWTGVVVAFSDGTRVEREQIRLTVIARVTWREKVACQVARTHDGLPFQAPVGIELQPRVQPPNAVELAGGRTFPVRVQSSHTGLFEDIAAHARNREVGSGAGERKIAGDNLPRTAVVSGHYSYGIWALFAGQSNARR